MTAWPAESDVLDLRIEVAKYYKIPLADVVCVASPYRACPLGAHVDHQGGQVSAIALNLGVLLAFAKAKSDMVILQSHNSRESICISTSCVRADEPNTTKGWRAYLVGAVKALKQQGCDVSWGMVGIVKGHPGADGAGISSSAALGCALLMALEISNDLKCTPEQNVWLDKLIENGMGIKNGILDQSAILLSKESHLTFINCKDGSHTLNPPAWYGNPSPVRFMLAFSGLRVPLTSTPGFNQRVDECTAAAVALLAAVGRPDEEPILGNITQQEFQQHKGVLKDGVLRRAEHFFGECDRVAQGIEAWTNGDLVAFGKLMSASGESSIFNYECGCEPMCKLRTILLDTKGVLGARFSGAGFRGCCVSLVLAEEAEDAAEAVLKRYKEAEPKLASEAHVMLLDPGHGARVFQPTILDPMLPDVNHFVFYRQQQSQHQSIPEEIPSGAPTCTDQEPPTIEPVQQPAESSTTSFLGSLFGA